MKLIQLLLPLYNEEDTRFPEVFYETIKREMTEKFGGITMYTRSPATGLWKENERKVVKDEIIIFEIMSKEVDHSFWRSYKRRLEHLFQQSELIIRVTNIEII